MTVGSRVDQLLPQIIEHRFSRGTPQGGDRPNFSRQWGNSGNDLGFYSARVSKTDIEVILAENESYTNVGRR